MAINSVYRRLKQCLLVALFCGPLVSAADLSVAWDASPDPTAIGYRVYCGLKTQALIESASIETTALTATVKSLNPGEEYNLAVVAVDAEGNESHFSNTLACRAPGLSPLNIKCQEDKTVTINLAANVTNWVGASFSILTPPAIGVLGGTPPAVSYKPALNFFGTDRFTYSATIAGRAIFGTVVVTVTPVNDVPTLSNLPSPIARLQNSGPLTIGLSGITAGPANEWQTITVSSVSTNLDLTASLEVGYETPEREGNVIFVPRKNVWGSTKINVSTSDGQATVSRSVVVHINNPPTLNALQDMTIDEDASAQKVTLSGISAGASNEASQPLIIAVTSSNPALVPAPTVSFTPGANTGSITFRPVAQGSGTSKITVTINDGQPANNTVSRAFTVRVNALNDAPKLNAISPVTVAANSGSKIISLSGISSGATNEAQNLTVTATSSVTSLIPTPIVTYTSPAATGQLTFKPTANKFGTSTVTVSVGDGVSVYQRSFIVTVTAPAPIISNLRKVSDDARTLSLAWNTDRSANCVVESISAPALLSAQSSGTSHAVTLTNLAPGTTYSFMVRATATNGTSGQAISMTTPTTSGLLFSAEDGQVVGAMAVLTNQAAENQGYIASSIAGLGKAEFALNVERGLNYRLWARVKTPAGGGTVSATIDGGAEQLLLAGDNGATNAWHWVLLTEAGAPGRAAVLPMDAGVRRLTLRAGTANVYLDEFAISNDTLWKPILSSTRPVLNGTRSSPDQVDLSWSDPSGNTENVGLEYSTDGVNFALFYVMDATESAFSVGNLEPGVRYYFRMFSFNSVDRTGYSNVVIAP